MNNNQLGTLFIFNLLNYHTSTCFWRIRNPSLGGRMYIVANGTSYTSELTVSGQAGPLRVNSAV
jgi:hypothetical protein